MSSSSYRGSPGPYRSQPAARETEAKKEEAMPKLTLYYSPGASSMATHIALCEVGAPFELKLIELYRQENRKPEYLAVNREGKVPTLVVEGSEPLTEVAATLWYLARQFPEAGLLPQYGDTEAEARVISWMSFIASTIHPARR